MFEIDSDMTIHVTRGDVAFFAVSASNGENKYKFQPGDVVRMKVMQRKNAENVAFHKDFLIHEEVEKVNILLTEAETKIGDVISKPTDYWYEIELNPYTNPQTIIGYDADGPKIFKLYPEGKDLGYLEEVEIPPVDQELSLTSERPIANQAVARALVGYDERVAEAVERINDTANETESAFKDATDAIAEEVMANINAEADSAIGRVHDSSAEADESAARAKTEADRAEEYAKVAQAVAGLEIDTELSEESYNPIANKAVAEEFGKYLKKSGGTVNGTLAVKGILAVGDTTQEAKYQELLRNANRNVSSEIDANGNYAFWDVTNSKYIFRADLDGTSTFYGKATECLPMSGGYITGAEAGIGDRNSESGYTWGLKNSKRFITEQVLADGTYRIRDTNNAKDIINSTADGTTTFEGTASGNLPLTGGSVGDATSNAPLSVRGNDKSILKFVKGNYDSLGYLGFNANGEPIRMAPDGATTNLLLHTGNSAKVHIDTTAPNDTTGQVLFINTSA